MASGRADTETGVVLRLALGFVPGFRPEAVGTEDSDADV